MKILLQVLLEVFLKYAWSFYVMTYYNALVLLFFFWLLHAGKSVRKNQQVYVA